MMDKQIVFLRTEAPATHHFQAEQKNIVTATACAEEYIHGHVHGPYMRGENNFWVVCACPECIGVLEAAPNGQA